MEISKTSGSRLQLGCQTNAWSIDPERPDTLFQALREIDELGFSGFETSFRNIPRETEKRDRLVSAARELTLLGVHIFLQQYDAETKLPPIEFMLDIAAAASSIGSERLIVSGAPAHEHARMIKANALNEIAGQIQPLGLELAYHNHSAELIGVNPEIATLLSETDPTLVSLLFDAGHAYRANIDAAEFIRKHSTRIAGIHLRDFKSGHQVPLGQGEFPLACVAKAVAEVSWSGWLIAEEEREDGSKPAIEAVGTARQSLRHAFGI